MSLFTVTGKSYTSPTFWVDGPVLYSETAFLIQLVCLFFYARRVAVDRRSEAIEITTRWFWGLRTTTMTIPFARIERIETTYTSWGTSWGLVGRTDEHEIYGIVLRLREPWEKYNLLDFGGEGSVHTGLKGVLLGDSIIDWRGDQEERFREYYDLVKEFTGK